MFQQAPATVWIPKSRGAAGELSLVSSSRGRAPGQGVHGLRAPQLHPGDPWDGSGAAAALSTRTAPCQPHKSRWGGDHRRLCSISRCWGWARWDRRALWAPEHGPTGLLSTKTHKPSLSSVASLITQTRPLCLAAMLRSCLGQPLSIWINISIDWCKIPLLQYAKNINNGVLRVSVLDGNGVCCSLGWVDVARAKAHGRHLIPSNFSPKRWGII